MIEITEQMLEGEGSKLLAQGITTDSEINYYSWGDKNKKLIFVVVKGYIDDWAIYLQHMEENVADVTRIITLGNKLHSIEAIKKLVKCSPEVLARYRQ